MGLMGDRLDCQKDSERLRGFGDRLTDRRKFVLLESLSLLNLFFTENFYFVFGFHINIYQHKY